MKKTSVYLTEAEAESLRRLSAATGRPQAAIVRDAVAEYVTKHTPERRFRSAGAGDSGRDRSGEDLDEVLHELLEEDQRQDREWRSS